MPTIHVSSLVTKEIQLSPDNLVESLQGCATELEKLAQDYRSMAAVLSAKGIKASEVDGDAHCGSFTVDDIDAGRLKQTGLVADYDENVNSDWKAFFIDSDMSDALAEALAEEGGPDVENEPDEEIVDEDEEDDEEAYVIDYDEDEDHDHDHDDEDSDDLEFDAEKKLFRFKCHGCDEEHNETLQTMYNGLKAVFDGLVKYRDTDDGEEKARIAAEIVDKDWELGFILTLLEKEYGMKPNQNADVDEEDADED